MTIREENRRDAHERVNPNLRGTVLRFIRNSPEPVGPLQIADALGLDKVTVRARVTELLQAEMIQEAGSRRTESGRSEAVYTVKAIQYEGNQGILALEKAS